MNTASLRFIANFGINLSGNNLALIQKTVLLTLLSMVNFHSRRMGIGRGKSSAYSQDRLLPALQHIAERCK